MTSPRGPQPMNSAISTALANFQEARYRRVVLGVVLLLGLALALLWPTTRTLLDEWGDTDNLTYTHGWLVALLCLWLVLRACAELDLTRIEVSWNMLLPLAIGSVLWLVLLRASIEVAHQALLPILLWLACRVALGSAAARALLFPAMFLYFAIPIWSQGNEILQQLTVIAMRVVLPVMGVSAYFDGHIVHIASGVFEIAGGCSGLHFFIVALAIAALHGELHRDPLRVRILLLVLAGGLAILANWVRVATIIVAGYLTDMQHFLVSVDHYYFGWVVFAIAMACFLFIANRLPVSDGSPAANSFAPQSREPGVSRLVTGVLAAVAAVSVGPAWALAQSTLSDARQSAEGAAPVEPIEQGEWQPVFRGADVINRGQRMIGERRVDTYAAEYWTQRQGKELIGGGNSVAGANAGIVRRTRTETPQGPVRELVVRGADDAPALLWYFYEVDAARLTMPLAVQLVYGVKSLVSAPIARVTALRAVCESDCVVERAVLAEALAQSSGLEKEDYKQ
jgi:exosortase